MRKSMSFKFKLQIIIQQKNYNFEKMLNNFKCLLNSKKFRCNNNILNTLKYYRS